MSEGTSTPEPRSSVEQTTTKLADSASPSAALIDDPIGSLPIDTLAEAVGERMRRRGVGSGLSVSDGGDSLELRRQDWMTDANWVFIRRESCAAARRLGMRIERIEDGQ